MLKKMLLLSLLVSSIITATTPSIETALAYQKNEQFIEAIDCYEDILRNDLFNLNAYFQAGCCYLAIGEKEKAVHAFTTVLAYSPHEVSAQYNLGYTYKTFGDLDKAIEIYQEIIANDPTYDAAQLALGFAYIAQGNLAQGWEQHKHYLMRSGKNGDKLRALIANNNVPYTTIVLLPEGGLGDTINFIRYAQRLKEKGADVVVVCQKQLVPLLSRCDYIDELMVSDVSLARYDAQATLMSLPAIFADTQESVPQTIPYLFADPTLVTYWHNRLSSDTHFKVGICWQVDAHNDTSKIPVARRGYPLSSFAQLADIEGVSFYSLQKYDGVEQLASLPASFKLHTFEDLDAEAGPFMDTAALIKNMDLVITVDTAVAHLAGALGCNVWLLHPYATADWRWVHGRTDSYWYPTMRIFKQHEPFGYDNVLQKVKKALEDISHAH